MTAPAPLPAELRALAYKTLIGDLEKELKGLDEPLNISHRLPGSGTYESPLDGAALGRITRERVKPVWLVTSLEQLTEHFTREYPGALETVFLLEVPGVGEPVALPEDHPITVALAQSAPELLTPKQRVPDSVIADALIQSEETGSAAAPGIQLVRRSQGKLSVVFDKKEAPGAVRRMLRAGLVTLPWDETAPVELDGLAS
jgi:hypothetical protein